MSDLSDAFTELQDAKAEAIGKREFVILKGRKVEGLVSEITADDSIVSGGIAEQGGFRVQIAQSAVARAPEKEDPIKCRGQKLQVLSCNDVNGVTYEITAGDLSAEVS